jgi:2-polyprenyl-3-methyl-5-hydroxy-6-metoxy-1,4-benzoquinol methylase
LAGILHRRGHEVLGVDMSQAKIRDAQTRYPDVDFGPAIFWLDIPDASFDTAVLTEILEHLPAAQGDEILPKRPDSCARAAVWW